MYQPIAQPGGEAIAVLEMWRENKSFNTEDEEICSSYIVWGGIAIHYASLYMDIIVQRKLGDFLLDVVKYVLIYNYFKQVI